MQVERPDEGGGGGKVHVRKIDLQALHVRVILPEDLSDAGAPHSDPHGKLKYPQYGTCSTI